MNPKQSTMMRAMTRDGAIRVLYAETTAIVNEAHKIHNTSKTMTAVLGRALTGTSLIGSLLKDKESSVTFQLKGDGPAGTIICVSDYAGNVRGCAGNPTIELPPNSKGKLDVGRAVGKGTLHVMKDLGFGDPYIGLAPIISGEIAEDLTNYFASSEQTPTVCALGVRTNSNNSCKAAGGYIIQLMPGADDEMITKLEESVRKLPAVTNLVTECATNEEVMARLLEGFEYDIFDELDIAYKCSCSRERYSAALISLGRDDLSDMYNDGQPVETVCHFCGAKYVFSHEEVGALLEEAK